MVACQSGVVGTVEKCVAFYAGDCYGVVLWYCLCEADEHGTECC